MTIDKAYDPKEIERDCYARWEKKGYFAPKAHKSEENNDPYCIMIPPPNVTGSLHMGHAFQQTLMDVLIRYQRMKGRPTLWQVGTDHAGIATQMVVERKLLQENISKESLGRDEFVKRIWQWKSESGDNITRQLRRMGASVDWSRERFTLDEGLSKAVLEVFIRLYEEGLIYRGKRLVNWDPILHTAVSDLEVESEEEKGTLYYLRYPLVDGEGYIIVATTRPETMLGDVAVAVHPEDERYRALIGKKIRLPLTDRLIPIISDTEVLQEFGTGCVKITPAHDFNDYAMGERHQLPKINILTEDAALNDEVPLPYRGLDRYVAREKIIEDLTTLNLIEKLEPYLLKVPRGDRSGAVLEPLLTDQWFVKIESLAKPAIEAVETGKIRFIPENWSKTYFEWMYNIQDWCISRQLWWGHRIPAWYDEENKNKFYVGRSEEDVRKKHSLPPNVSLKQDNDVLDTWFSSALWPFSTLGWPEKTDDFKTFYPSQVLVTGFDIIFFWVARMIMFGLKFTGEIPFHEVYIHGLIQDQDGQKMSKTKGNVLDPIDLIDGIDLESLVIKRTSGMMQPHLAKSVAQHTRKQFPNGIPAYGTDALRFTFCALATTARHIRFDLNRIEGYRHFCNKLWNASRFVFMNIENKEIPKDFELSLQSLQNLTIADRWILSRWQRTKDIVQEQLRHYRFDLASSALYEFTWNEYCDWYLELTKPILQSHNEQAIRTRCILVTVLEELLRALHPFMPYITEEIWQRLAPKALKIHKKDDTIMLQPYPEPEKEFINNDAESDMKWIQSVILGIRKLRDEENLPANITIPEVFLYNENKEDKIKIEIKLAKYETYLQSLCKIKLFTWLKGPEPNEMRPGLNVVWVGDLVIGINPKSDNVQAKYVRLEKEKAKKNKESEILRNQLANENFRKNAPPDISYIQNNNLYK